MKKEKYIEEKQLKNNVASVPIKALAILIPKAQENICKIYCTNGSHGTGFFCNIQYYFNFTMKVLMTNHHVLNEEDILKGRKIVFSTNNDKIFHEVLIDESRKIYTDKIMI
jgi:hypothetical protein